MIFNKSRFSFEDVPHDKYYRIDYIGCKKFGGKIEVVYSIMTTHKKLQKTIEKGKTIVSDALKYNYQYYVITRVDENGNAI